MRKVSEELIKQLTFLDPMSIVVTGSAASGEETPKSDIELAIIFEDENYRSRTELMSYGSADVRIYPFRLSEIKELTSKVPFPVHFYFWWIQNNSRTLFGEQILENLQVNMTAQDWKDLLAFERGVALSAMIAFRNGDQAGAEWGFSKSCLFGALAGLGLRGKTVTSYMGIREAGKKAYFDFQHLIERAEQVRQGQTSPTERDIFQNHDFLHTIAQTQQGYH